MNDRHIPKLPAVTPPAREPSTLPFNGRVVSDRVMAYSFSCFDRSHALFNLGNDKAQDKVVPKEWFLDLLDCLKDVGGKTIQEMKNSPWCLHPVDWRHANVRCPTHEQQHEYWQFRLGKSRGRIIGIKIDTLFYVVWLDAHHNLTESEGYGIAQRYCRPSSEYESLLNEKKRLEIENRNLLNLLDQKTQL